ncbi:MAG: DUF2845 domain-containing protein [Legionella longbeachae]|nr:DUF2845 domain-containing protein [Legionella longbeachae]
MKLTLLVSTVLGLLILPLSLFADGQSYYCPQNHAYIQIGMTPDQVIAACGQPVSQQETNQPVLQKVPVQQLIYNNLGTSTAFYGVWNLPTGSGGVQLEIDIVDQKVRAIKLDGANSNAVSVCQGVNIQAGDPAQKVFYSCGNPSMVNNSYINEVVPTTEKPKIWVFQPGQYQSPVTMTFVNGKLLSIQ